MSAERTQEVPAGRPQQPSVIALNRPMPVPGHEEIRVIIDYLPETNLMPDREAETEEHQSVVVAPQDQDGDV